MPLLLLRREHQVTVALVLGGERGEDPAGYAEIGRAHMRAFLHRFEAQSNPAEIKEKPQVSGAECIGPSLRSG